MTGLCWLTTGGRAAAALPLVEGVEGLNILNVLVLVGSDARWPPSFLILLCWEGELGLSQCWSPIYTESFSRFSE